MQPDRIGGGGGGPIVNLHGVLLPEVFDSYSKDMWNLAGDARGWGADNTDVVDLANVVAGGPCP